MTYELLLVYSMVILTCVYWFRNMAGAHPLMSSHRKVAPATDDVINDVTHEMPVWCQPCGIAVNQLETLGQQNAVYELQMAIEATMPLANRLQRQTLSDWRHTHRNIRRLRHVGYRTTRKLLRSLPFLVESSTANSFRRELERLWSIYQLIAAVIDRLQATQRLHPRTERFLAFLEQSNSNTGVYPVLCYLQRMIFALYRQTNEAFVLSSLCVDRSKLADRLLSKLERGGVTRVQTAYSAAVLAVSARQLVLYSAIDVAYLRINS